MQISLHLGAHRTGSTYIQHQLMNHAREFEANAVRVISLDRMRATITKEIALPWYGYLKPGILRKRKISEYLKKEAKDPLRRLVISDENLLGAISGIFSNRDFYPGVSSRLRCLADALTGYEVDVFIAIRSYDWFFSSAYAHAVKSRKLPDFESLKPRLLGFQRGWVDVAADLKILFPESNLSIWTHENFRNHEWMIFNKLLGYEWQSQNLANHWWANSSPSQKAIEEIMVRRRAKGDLTKSEVDSILKKYPKCEDNAGFHPWSPDEKLIFQNRYQQDIRSMDALCDRF